MKPYPPRFFATGLSQRTLLTSISGCVLLNLFSCGPIRQTISMENRIFVRVPGEIPSKEIPVTDGWHFRHVVEGPTKNKKVAPAQWYVVWHDNGRDRLPGSGRFPAWNAVLKLAPEIAEASLTSLGAYPQLVEPGLVFKEDEGKAKRILPGKLDSSDTVPDLMVNNLPSAAWSSAGTGEDGFHNALWHLDDDHSQLASARKAVRQKTGGAGEGIRIGFLDTGFDSRQVGLPRYIINEPEGEAVQELKRERDVPGSGGFVRRTPGEVIDTGHATGTIGILAGRKVNLIDPSRKGGKPYARQGVQEIGGAPDATLVAVRVAPWVASLSSANLAYGIDYASRKQKCDVISMSHGGSPSMMWTDAVNAAYDRGTAIFAATGDYVSPPMLPEVPGRFGMFVPSSSVYPAAFRRVVGVTGVNENGTSYTSTDWKMVRKNPFSLSHWTNFMKGSYGADGVRRSLLNFSLKSESHKTDIVQKERQNELRANPIAGYTPNVPWLSAGKVKSEGPVNGVSLAGGGTSAATPQAAAAAANWLAYHEKELRGANAWDNWRKAEAVYMAMLLSADRPWATGNPTSHAPDMKLGAGRLKAKDMLDVSYNDVLSIKGETLTWAPNVKRKSDSQDVYPDSGGSPRDFYDSQRSFVTAALAINRDSITSEDIKRSADIRLGPEHVYRSASQRTAALKNLYFNMLLLQKFQVGDQPKKLEYLTPVGKFFHGEFDQPGIEREAERYAEGRKGPVRYQRHK